MKRICAAVFLLFYTVAVVTSSVQRAETGASELAHALKHLRPNPEPGVGEAHKRPLRQIHGKLFEDHSVLISSFVRSFAPPYVQDRVHPSEVFIISQGSQTDSSRAPPSLL